MDVLLTVTHFGRLCVDAMTVKQAMSLAFKPPLATPAGSIARISMIPRLEEDTNK
jgi:hypothetical protein